jgi:putative flippase GtrA
MSTPLEQLPLRTQLTRFVITGGLSAIVDFGLLLVGMAFGLSHTVAKALSFVAGTATAYAINRRWTFGATGSKRKFAAVMALYGITFALQVGIFALLYPALVALGLGADLLPRMSPAQLIGFVVAQGVATAVNFVVQRALIFR